MQGVRVPSATLAGAGAAVLWALTCIAWFDPGQRLLPAARTVVLPACLALAALLLGAVWLRARWPALRGPQSPGPRGGALLVVLLAFFFRLPLAWHGAAGYTTPDGAISGLVALPARGHRPRPSCRARLGPVLRAVRGRGLQARPARRRRHDRRRGGPLRGVR